MELSFRMSRFWLQSWSSVAVGSAAGSPSGKIAITFACRPSSLVPPRGPRPCGAYRSATVAGCVAVSQAASKAARASPISGACQSRGRARRKRHDVRLAGRATRSSHAGQARGYDGPPWPSIIQSRTDLRAPGGPRRRNPVRPSCHRLRCCCCERSLLLNAGRCRHRRRVRNRRLTPLAVIGGLYCAPVSPASRSCGSSLVVRDQIVRAARTSLPFATVSWGSRL